MGRVVDGSGGGRVGRWAWWDLGRGGGPEGWGPEGVGAEGWGAQNFAFFFSLSHRKFHSFFPLWGVFSWNFGGVFEKCACLGSPVV